MADKNIIVLSSINKTYPDLREGIAAYILDNPAECDLKEFLFEVLEELRRRNAV